jgi:hypothetical protein
MSFMDSEKEKQKRWTRMRAKLREQFDMPPDWPIRIDWETMEYYSPLDRYLEQLRKRRTDALFKTLHSVIEAERRGEW